MQNQSNAIGELINPRGRANRAARLINTLTARGYTYISSKPLRARPGIRIEFADAKTDLPIAVIVN